MKRILGAALGLILAGSVSAQEFMCGSAACTNLGGNAIFNTLVTGIDNLVVDGKTYDMAFSTSMASPFSTQGSSGVDAANAIESFFAKQTPFFDDGPGMGISLNGQLSYSTAFQTAQYLSPQNALSTVLAPVFWSVNVTPQVLQSQGPLQCLGTCTTWTQVTTASAPELDSGSAVGALTLLFGGIAVVAGAGRTRFARTRA